MTIVSNSAFNSGDWNGAPSGANAQIINTPEVKSGFAAQIARIMPNGSAPLFALTSRLKEKMAVRPEHGFFGKIMLFPSVTTHGSNITGLSGNTAATITVVSTAQIAPGMLLRAQAASTVQQHTLLVTAITSATEFTAIPNIGGSTNTTIPANSVFQQIGNAHAEASDRPASYLTKTVPINNYTQIFRNTWAISDTVRATMMDVGDGNIAESRRECAAYHATAIEDAFFFGRRQTLAAVSQLGRGPLRTMGGLIDLVADTTIYTGGASANLHEAGSTTTLDQLETYLESTLVAQSEDATGTNDRWVFCGATALKVFNKLARLNGDYELTSDKTTFGLQYRVFKTTRGTFNLVEHALFNRSAFYAKHAVVVDLPSISAVYLRKTKTDDFNINGQQVDNGIDAVGGTLTSELTLECRNPQGCAIITNLTAAAAS